MKSSPSRLIEKVDAKNQKAAYVYDDARRLEEILYFATAGDSVAVKAVTFSYDKVGNLTGCVPGTAHILKVSQAYQSVARLGKS